MRNIIVISLYYLDMPIKKALARRLRHAFRAPPDGRSREMSGGASAKGSKQWILAGFHDGISFKEARLSASAQRSASDPHPPPPPPSASSLSAPATTPGTIRRTRKGLRR